MTIKIKGIECENAKDALRRIPGSAPGSSTAITIGSKALVVAQAEAHRIAAMGVGFAYLCDHELPDGTHRIVTIPVND